MEEIEKEKSLDNYPNPVTIEGTNKILNQLKTCICKIENKKGNGTGFLCYIPYKNKNLKVLITNNHVINQEFINENKEIGISFNDDKEFKTIELKNKKIYTSIEYDTTIIEIKEKENINNYLELDEKIIKHNINLSNKSVYILQYPKYSDGQKASVSYGIIKNIQDEFNIIHYCCTESGSSGSPILDLLNNKIIGIHKESVKNKNYNKGTILKYPINEYLNKFYNNKKNEINLTINVDKYDINKNIFFLNYDGGLFISDDELQKVYENSIEYFNKLLNESKIEIILNDKKIENKRFFIPKEVGEYNIKLIFKTNISNMSFMFYNCSKMTNIDLSSFITENATNMCSMFCKCSKMTNLDLSSFDTRNVTNMSFMFSRCHGLKNLDLSSFDTRNVTNMFGMFSADEECDSDLENIDLSSFDTRNVINMAGLFFNCNNLINLDLSSFNTKKVTDMMFMFARCEKLQRINVSSSFDTSNVKNMEGMFFYCKNLADLDLSSFNTRNVKNMEEMFSNCKNLANLDLSSFNTQNVASMKGMFECCENLVNLDLSSFNTRNVNNMDKMFCECKKLINLNLSSFDTKNVTDMFGMFESSNLIYLDLSSFDTKNVTNMAFMFDTENLKNVKINDIISNKNLKEELKDYGINAIDKFGNNIKI